MFFVDLIIETSVLNKRNGIVYIYIPTCATTQEIFLDTQVTWFMFFLSCGPVVYLGRILDI